MNNKKQVISRIDRPIEPLPIVVRNEIAQLIQNGTFAPGDKMPVEPELATRLGVSRGTLREALRLLEEDSFISRRAGVGTFVRMLRPAVASNSLEKNFGALEVMESMGLKPEHIEIESRTIEADPIISDILKVKKNSPLVFLQRVIKVDKKRVLYAMNILLRSIIKNHDLSGFKESLCEFLEKKCNQKIDYGIAKIIPVVAGDHLSQKLKIDVGSSLLLIEQVSYNVEDRPIYLSREYWVKDFVEFTIFRDRRK